MAPYLIFLITYALLKTASGTAVHAEDNDSLGIIGGDEVSIKEFPYMAAVYIYNEDNDYYILRCGGSIVHEHFILTAAHCVFKYEQEINDLTAIVVIGTDYLNNGTQIDVEKAICHEDFNYGKRINDICLLKLYLPVKFGDTVALVKLPETNMKLKVGAEVNVTGWGAISGDSGGPLTHSGVQVGIVSYFRRKSGHEICSSYPGAYTDVISYLGWINTTITDNL